MHGRTVVITGGNSGIGLETVVGLTAAGARVVMGCRNSTKADAALEQVRERVPEAQVEARPLDLADLDVVDRFVASLEDLDRIDVLINNAGLILDHREETAQGFEAIFGTNHLGPFRLTNGLLPRILDAPQGRVINVASVAHRLAPFGLSWADLDRRKRFNGWLVYGESKLANILHTRGLARRLDGTRAVAHSLHPGSVASGFGRDGDLHGFNDRLLWAGQVVLISPLAAARTPIFLASAPTVMNTNGDYWYRCRRYQPSAAARDTTAAERLWNLSLQLTD